MQTTERQHFLLATDILTEQDQMILMALRDSERRANFLIGRMAQGYVNQSIYQGLPVTAKQIYEAIGLFCGRSTRTVRYYKEVADAYSEDEEELYSGLPFSYLSWARSLGTARSTVLGYASSRPWLSLEDLSYHYENGYITEDENEPLGAIEDDSYTGLSESQEKRPTSFPERPRASTESFGGRGLLSRLVDLVEAISELADRYDISDPLRDELDRALVSIRRVVREIAR